MHHIPLNKSKLLKIMVPGTSFEYPIPRNRKKNTTYHFVFDFKTAVCLPAQVARLTMPVPLHSSTHVHTHSYPSMLHLFRHLNPIARHVVLSPAARVLVRLERKQWCAPFPIYPTLHPLNCMNQIKFTTSDQRNGWSLNNMTGCGLDARVWFPAAIAQTFSSPLSPEWFSGLPPVSCPSWSVRLTINPHDRIMLRQRGGTSTFTHHRILLWAYENMHRINVLKHVTPQNLFKEKAKEDNIWVKINAVIWHYILLQPVKCQLS
jgi:hypothetical protein